MRYCCLRPKIDSAQLAENLRHVEKVLRGLVMFVSPLFVSVASMKEL